MPKFTTEIPAQKLEIIGPQIGVILADELSGQYAITQNEDYKVGVWVERSIPFTTEECPAINVVLASGEYSGKTDDEVHGSYIYYIDIKVAAAAKELEGGGVEQSDKRAATKLTRLVGMVRYILDHPVYRTLLFTPPFNGRFSIQSFFLPDSEAPEGEETIATARIQVNISAPELAEHPEGVLATQSVTTVKLYNTEKGFLYALPALYISSLVGLENLEAQEDVIALSVSVTTKQGVVILDNSMQGNVYTSFQAFVETCLNGTLKAAHPEIKGSFQLVTGQGIWYKGTDLTAGFIEWDKGGFDVGFDIGFD